MSDTDLDIEPALDAHLRRTFREVAATVTDTATDNNVIRLVTAPAPRPGRHRWAWLGAAAAAGLVAGAGLMAVADRETDQAAVPAASTTVAVDPETVRLVLTDSCLGLHGAADAMDGRVSVLLFGPVASDIPATVLVSTADTFFTCGVSPEGEIALTDWSSVGPLPDPPAPGALQVLEVRATTSRAELVGPGRIVVVGRAGGAVDTVDLELPDGGTATAQLESGWFLVDARVAGDVPLTEARLTWRDTSGETTSRRVDVLDEDTVVEACAREPGCVEAEVDRLHDAAAAAGLDEQAAILADGAVTDDERVASLNRFAECFNAAGTGATATVSGTGGVRVGTSKLDDGAAADFALDVHELCRAAHSYFVDQAYALLDAQQRVAEG